MGPWVTISEADFLNRSNDAERSNYEESESNGDITSDKLCGIISNVIAFVRGRVASCGRNDSFGDSNTVPPECVHHALSIVRNAFLSSTGATDILQGEERDTEYRDAITYFDRVADCKEVITPDGGTTGSHESLCYGSETQLDFSV